MHFQLSLIRLVALSFSFASVVHAAPAPVVVDEAGALAVGDGKGLVERGYAPPGAYGGIGLPSVSTVIPTIATPAVVLPPVTNVLPTVTNIVPTVTNVLPTVPNVLPTVTNIIPTITNIIPSITGVLPSLTGLSSVSVSVPLPVPSSNPTQLVTALLNTLLATITRLINSLVVCSKTPGCNTAPIIASISDVIRDFVTQVTALLNGGAKINVTVCLTLYLRVFVTICTGLKAAVGLGPSALINLKTAMLAYLSSLLKLAAANGTKATISIQIKTSLPPYTGPLQGLLGNLLGSVGL